MTARGARGGRGAPEVGGFSIEDMLLITDRGPELLSTEVGTEEMIVIDG